MTMTGDEPFDWAMLVPRVVHPLQVAIVEALWWIDRPLSASELELVFVHQFGLSLISYHVQQLRKAGALEEVGREQVRGALKRLYFFASDESGRESAGAAD
jgi:hypothetical protein